MSAAPFDVRRIGRGLPFAESVPALQEALRGGAAVVQAPPDPADVERGGTHGFQYDRALGRDC